MFRQNTSHGLTRLAWYATKAYQRLPISETYVRCRPVVIKLCRSILWSQIFFEFTSVCRNSLEDAYCNKMKESCSNNSKFRQYCKLTCEVCSVPVQSVVSSIQSPKNWRQYCLSQSEVAEIHTDFINLCWSVHKIWRSEIYFICSTVSLFFMGHRTKTACKIGKEVIIK